MSTDRLAQLYQDMILEHNRNPRNFKIVVDATHRSHGVNPLCGDDYFIFLKVENDVVTDVGFQGKGCAISKSSASLLTTKVVGKPVSDVLALKDNFLDVVTQDHCDHASKTSLGSLVLFEGVKQFPVRVKCATLIWRALEHALTSRSADETVTTE